MTISSKAWNLDRGMRLALGLLLVALFVASLQSPSGWMSVLPLATAVVAFLPSYWLIRASTRPGPPSTRPQRQ